MAVLNGERMHDTMERLLPGARSAALLWQGAAVLGGAALGAGQVYGGAGAGHRLPAVLLPGRGAGHAGGGAGVPADAAGR